MKVDASRRAKIKALAAIFVVVVPAFTFADEAADRKAEAQRLFAQGQAALDKGDTASGCVLMRTSLELFAVANSLFNVAQCDERDGKLASALAHWQRGLSLVDSKDKRVPVAKKSIEMLEARLPRLNIIVPPKYAPLEVLIDEEDITADKLAAPFFVDVGKRVITIRKAGYEDHTVEILLNERERTEVIAELGAPVAQPLASAIPTTSVSVAPPPPPGMSPMKVGGFVALGVGGLGLLGGAITSGIISSQHGQIGDECPQKVCSTEGRSLIRSQETLLPLNATFWGIGIAGAAAGTVLLVISGRAGKDERKTPVVAPLVLPNGGGIGLSGRF